MINNYWGQPGPAGYAWLEFFGSGGAYFRKDLIGNDDIRDFSQGAYTNDINGVTTINVVAVGARRLDKQRIVLRVDFRDETLLSVRMGDNGADYVQRAFLAGITVLVNGSGDCNGNGAPDECDIANGESGDANGDTVPDECVPCGWINWPVTSGGNGHFFRAVHTPSGISWDDARSAAAAAADAYLVSIRSSAENSFVFDLIGSPEFWWGPDPAGDYEGPWLGGFQPPGSPEPAGGWIWDGGELIDLPADLPVMPSVRTLTKARQWAGSNCLGLHEELLAECGAPEGVPVLIEIMERFPRNEWCSRYIKAADHNDAPVGDPNVAYTALRVRAGESNRKGYGPVKVV